MRLEQHRPTRQTGLCCSLLGHSRQAFYQFKKQSEVQALQEELVVRQVIGERKIMERLGCRKLLLRLHDFLQQHAINMGRDAFFDLLRRNGLLVRRRKRKMATTDSNHWLRKYPNLVKGFIPIAPNQLWVADITYLVLGNGFAYLSLTTDAFSHKTVGFFLSPDLSAHGCCQALVMALKNNPSIKGLIHHSDRGVQYCSDLYVNLLNGHQVKISMAENGDPLENALAERMNGILKDELLEECYPSFEAAQQGVAVAISTYNHLRPHGSISNFTPVQAHTLTGLVLKRTWKNYYKPKPTAPVNTV
jgi:putative transposase